MIFTQPGQTIQMDENERFENAKGYILLFLDLIPPKPKKRSLNR